MGLRKKAEVGQCFLYLCGLGLFCNVSIGMYKKVMFLNIFVSLSVICTFLSFSTIATTLKINVRCIETELTKEVN